MVPNAPAANDELAQGLGSLGLPAEEARAYLLLLRRGPSFARDVVAPLGLPRTKAYRLLNGLMRRGFAHATLQRPSRFVAVPAEQAFDLLRREAETRLDTVRREAERLRPLLARLLPADDASGQDGGVFRLVQGAREVRSVAATLAARARVSLDVMESQPPAAKGPRSAWSWVGLREAPRPGVRVRVVHDAPGLEARSEEALPGYRRLPGLIGTRLVLVDREELLLDVTEPGGGESAAFWSARSRVVGAMVGFFDVAWRLADPAVDLLEGAPDAAAALRAVRPTLDLDGILAKDA